MHPGGGAKGPIWVGMSSRCYKVAPDGPHDAGLVESSPGRAGCRIEVRRGGFRARKGGSLPVFPGMGRICR